MVPSLAGFSWLATLRALRHPGAPPPGLWPVGVLLVGASVVAILTLIWLGQVRHDNPHHFFGERKIGTYLSFLNLVGAGAVAAIIGRRLGAVPFARFWTVTAVGFVWLGCDDLFVLHERIDRGVHALLGLDPDHPVTDHLDDAIVAGYGVAALGLAHRYRGELARLPWMHLTLGVAFALFAGMVVVDVLHWSKTVEDGLKVLAGTLILVGFVAARLELAQLGLARPPRCLAHAHAGRAR